jgi:hypothetical protein
METTYIIRKVSTHEGETYQLYDFDKRQVVAQGRELALTKVTEDDNYTHGGTFIQGYAYMSPKELNRLANNLTKVRPKIKRTYCSEPCGMCDSFGCVGHETLERINNKVILEWTK